MTIQEDPFFFLPNLAVFLNGNSFLGSYRGLRFQVKPETEQEGQEIQALSALVWLGENCLEESEIQAGFSAPATEEGRQAVIDWLAEQYNTLLLS